MFDRITAAEAAAERWDVVIAGSSFSAMFFLRGLPRDARVLIVEKGPLIPHAVQVEERSRPQEPIALDNRSDMPKRWVAHTMFGGNSNCWWGQVPRFHPADFRLFEDHGVGAPWPLDYDALEPFYAEVEQVMEVAGPDDDPVHPRSGPFPYPPHTLSRTDAACIAARPDIWLPVACARANGGARNPCCANGVCDLCPVDSKFSILNGMGAFTREGVRIAMETELRQVDIAAGAATGVLLRDADGAETRVHAGHVALGTNAIGNAAILLRSGLTSPALGRYLHEQTSQDVILDVGAPNYFGGTSITGHCFAFYDGAHRDTTAAALVENYNAPNELRSDRGRWIERMRLKLIAEDLPQPGNRITLDDAGEPQITWLGHSHYAYAGIARAEERLADILPFPVEGIVGKRFSHTEAHIQGTHRMGHDPTQSVTDDLLRCHGLGGLHALGSGAFPTSSAANPTLTLSALALRAGRSV
ncbi:GMC family oxidoreductase [Psychromarinibacter sp. C21-152]|uniref:GMC family oxidoreductase n=1 Tax=Psychromarinibacter sediminicola TaxID=3033385 RepID=A0AAE3NXC0_9RHOB|nr:GMC family oxidoreductase [Psychromarinibacter sediminicola]MDF0602670.1 GMC family oxidoreductase [Psychromarinibacter sediminicola]